MSCERQKATGNTYSHPSVNTHQPCELTLMLRPLFVEKCSLPNRFVSAQQQHISIHKWFPNTTDAHALDPWAHGTHGTHGSHGILRDTCDPMWPELPAAAGPPHEASLAGSPSSWQASVSKGANYLSFNSVEYFLAKFRFQQMSVSASRQVTLRFGFFQL